VKDSCFERGSSKIWKTSIDKITKKYREMLMRKWQQRGVDEKAAVERC